MRDPAGYRRALFGAKRPGNAERYAADPPRTSRPGRAPVA